MGDVSHNEFLPFLLQELPESSSCRGEDVGDQDLVHMCMCTFIREMGEVKPSDSSIKGLRKYSLEL